ncbi:MAG TPA: hypothetical protein VH482_10290 [Thermomicrobiales bacterium]
MNQSVLAARSALRAGPGAAPSGSSVGFRCRHGHLHRSDQPFSRRAFARSAVGASALVLAAGRLGQHRVAAQTPTAEPRPIPGGIDLGGGNLIHVYDYSQGFEPASITDFRGFVGIHHLRGEGTVTGGGGGGSGISTPTATGDRLSYDTDMRFMKGTFVGKDGQEHEGTFGFV